MAPRASWSGLLAAIVIAGWSLAAAAGAADGDLDTTFGTPPSATGIVPISVDAGGDLIDTGYAVALAANGSLLVAGSTQTGSNPYSSDSVVARLFPNGEIDTFFGINGRVVFDANYKGRTDQLTAIGELSTREIVVAGNVEPNGALVAKLAPTGAVLDQRVFGFPDLAGFRALVVQPDDRIVLVGWVNRSTNYAMLVMRLTPDLARDPTFGTNGERTIDFDLGGGGDDDDLATAVALDSQGRIVVGGYAAIGFQDREFAVARLLPNGALDMSFSGDGLATAFFDLGATHHEDGVLSLAIGDGDTILAGGNSQLDVFPFERATFVRFLADGTGDGSFGNLSAGRLVLNTIDGDLRSATGLAITGTGQIYAAGSFRYTGRLGLARITPAGVLDSTFGGGDGSVSYNAYFPGGVDGGWGLVLQGGRPLLVGYADYSSMNLDTDMVLVRLQASLIFADGFESATLWRWSSASP